MWQLYSSHSPKKGKNLDEIVQILWNEDRRTDSRIIWYGDKTRSEYRLTRFGKRFPFLSAERVGDLFVLIPVRHREFKAYVFGRDDEISALLHSLGVDLRSGWGVYAADGPLISDSADCETRASELFVERSNAFPAGDILSDYADQIVDDCYGREAATSVDERLIHALDVEYRLFQRLERKLCAHKVQGGFASIDSFLDVAARIMNRRKSRAGRCLENHVAKALERAGIIFDQRVRDIQGEPDFVIPGSAHYRDRHYPREKVFVLAVKTTCKDRWRQVLDEGPDIKQKHLLTTQAGISDGQIAEMVRAKVSLIVPEPLHEQYSSTARQHLSTVEQFLETVQRTSAA